MNYLGYNKDNYHNADTLVDGNLDVNYDLTVKGDTILEGDIIIDPGCLKTDCIQENNLNSFAIKNSAGTNVLRIDNIDNIFVDSSLQVDEVRPKTASGDIQFNAFDTSPIMRLDNTQFVRASDIKAFTGDGTLNLENQAGTSNIKVQGAGGVLINDEYRLPIVDGTIDQVPTTDGAGVVTFQTQKGSNSVIGYVSNLNDFSNNSGSQSCIAYTGGTKTVQVNSLNIGGSFKVWVSGVMKVNEVSAGAGLFGVSYTFQLTFGGASTGVNSYLVLQSNDSFASITSGINNYSNVIIECSVIRTGTNTFQPYITGIASDYKTSSTTNGDTSPLIPSNQITTFNTFSLSGDPDTSTITFDLRYTNNITAGVWSTQFLAYLGNWSIQQLSAVSPAVLLTDDHTLLNNLNAGADSDGGHSSLITSVGRTGGQTIIGGKTAGEHLILQSNGANPLIGNVQLSSGFDTGIHKIFSNSVASPLVIEHESAIDRIDLRIGTNNKVQVTDTVINALENLNMNNNNIVNCTEISANSGAGIMKINNNGSNAVELFGNGTIRRVQVSNAVYMLSGSNLYMDNSDIENVDSINPNTTGAPLIIGNVTDLIKVNNKIYGSSVNEFLDLGITSANIATVEAGNISQLNAGVSARLAVGGVTKFSCGSTVNASTQNFQVNGGNNLDVISGILKITAGYLDMNNNNINNVNSINSVATGFPLLIGNVGEIISLKGSVQADLTIRQHKILFPSSNGNPVLSGFYSMLTPITNNVLTEVSVFNDTGSFGTRTMPAFSLNAGSSFSTSIRGTFTTAGASTLTARAKLNGVTVATSILSSFNVNAGTNWFINADWSIITTGAGGTGYGSGLFIADDLGDCVSTSISASFAINTTVANTVDITLQWVQAGDTLTSHIATIKANY